MTPDLLTQLMVTILDCACECLEEAGICGCPCRTCIIAGPPVWDQESCCNNEGSLYIHLDRIFQHDNFPREASEVNLCQAPLAADIVVTRLRCFPGMHEDGTAPTCPEMEAASNEIYQDLYVLTRCLLCSLASWRRNLKSVFRGSRIVGPQGGCVGVELRFTVELPDPLPL